jgi:hypothetical protein
VLLTEASWGQRSMKRGSISHDEMARDNGSEGMELMAFRR